jgi:hypothetical protein
MAMTNPGSGDARDGAADLGRPAIVAALLLLLLRGDTQPTSRGASPPLSSRTRLTGRVVVTVKLAVPERAERRGRLWRLRSALANRDCSVCSAVLNGEMCNCHAIVMAIR